VSDAKEAIKTFTTARPSRWRHHNLPKHQSHSPHDTESHHRRHET